MDGEWHWPKDSLQYAAFRGDLEAARRFLEEGVDVGAYDDPGQTALHTAIENREIEMVKFLISKGADVEQETMGGWSALIHALDIETDAASQRGVAPSTKLLELLIACGADVNRRCGWGVTPLEFARKLHNRAAIDILVGAGAR